MTTEEARGYLKCLRQLRRELKKGSKRFMALQIADVLDWAQDRIDGIHKVYGPEVNTKEAK